jgi:type IV pilus assembly protein PilV
MNPRRRRLRLTFERGTTLLEAMIALTVLLIGLVAMARLQIFGIGATQGARAQTIATQLALELGNALSQLDASDLTRLAGTAGADADTPPVGFGRLIDRGLTPGVAAPAPIIEWDDANPVPGARLDATIERDPEYAGQPIYKRRWTVWNAGVAANGVAAKVIAVSVIFRDRSVVRRKEVVLYVHSEIKGSFMANLTAFN